MVASAQIQNELAIALRLGVSTGYPFSPVPTDVVAAILDRLPGSGG
jgi:hypothetical protein